MEMKSIGRAITLCLLALGSHASSRIEITRAGKDVQLTWTGGVLQTAPSATGPWTQVEGSTSPHKVPVGLRAYYRVQETYSVTVTKTGVGAGSIRSLPTGVDCGSDCSETFLSGQAVQLQALPETGSAFLGWSGDCTGTADCVLNMGSPKTVQANFGKAAASNPIVNSGFEEGLTSGWLQYPDTLIYSSAQLGVPAHSGQNMARLGYSQDNRRLVQIGQKITLPDTRPLYLNFAIWLSTEELCDVPWYDNFSIYIAGQAVVNEDRICRGSDTGGWRRYSIGLDAVAGQTVGVLFELSSADALSTIALLDDISINSQPWQ